MITKKLTDLRTKIGQNDNTIKWVVVRPSSLIDEEDVSEYKTHSSTRSAIFNDGKVSRVNVAAFMNKPHYRPKSMGKMERSNACYL